MSKRKPPWVNVREMLDASTNSDEGFAEKKVSLPMMQVGRYRLHASAVTAEHFSSRHFITVHLNHNPAVKELNLNGSFQRGSSGLGDMCLTPATTLVSAVRIQEPSELVAIHIEPAFFAQTFAEIADAKKLELIPQFKLRDPLIYQMAIALRTQIESSKEKWDRLYIESMVTVVGVVQNRVTLSVQTRSSVMQWRCLLKAIANSLDKRFR